MSHIVLTPDQARLVCESREPLEVRDEQGRTLASLTPLSPADREAIERSREARARGGPRVPSEQVQAHLKRLDEISQTEVIDETKALELLRRMRAGEQI